MAVIGDGLGGLSFPNSALYAENTHLYEVAAEFTEVVSTLCSKMHERLAPTNGILLIKIRVAGVNIAKDAKCVV
jgi:L-asparagine transporter-like permease